MTRSRPGITLSGTVGAASSSRSQSPQFRAINKDAVNNRSPATPKLTMPVLAVGGEKSFGAMMAVVMRAAATDVHEAIVHGAGHWVREEKPAFVISLSGNFLSPASSCGAGLAFLLPPAVVRDDRSLKIRTGSFRISHRAEPGVRTPSARRKDRSNFTIGNCLRAASVSALCVLFDENHKSELSSQLKGPADLRLKASRR